jgi:hypothetical protein
VTQGHFQPTLKIRLIAIAGFAILCIWVVPQLRPTYAQTDALGWTSPELLFEGPGVISTPLVLADQAGGIHVFWSYDEPGLAVGTASVKSRAIYYSRWDGKEWSTANDILVASEASAASGAIDSSGYLHLTWGGPNNQLYYSRASVLEATSARAWTSVVLADQASMHSQILADAAGRLHVVYSGSGPSGPFYMTSADGGNHWSTAVNIAPTSTPTTTADVARLAIGPGGDLHVVWTEYQSPTGWPPAGLFYSHSSDNGRTWSTPSKIAGEGYNQINVAVAPNGNVHLAWNGIAGVGGRYHRWSADAGQTWSQITKLATPGIGGSEGPPQLIFDSAGNLHLLTTDDGCVWYNLWQDQAWTTPVCLSKAAHIEFPSLAVSGGNQLHAVFWHDLGSVWRLWHSASQAAAPSVPPVPFPSPTPLSGSTAGPDATGSASPPGATATVNLGVAGEERQSESPGTAIFIATVPVALMTAVVVCFRVIRAARR